ncbi:MAG: hypothetical protein QM723_14550 [Myxococcaceae bacterium]
MSEARTFSNVVSLRSSVDAVKESVDRLEALLPDREDNAVLLDFLEDDLRESLDAISDVESHFTDVLDTLRTEPLTPQALVNLADDTRVLNRLEYLMVVASQLRKRLTQAAGRIKLAR